MNLKIVEKRKNEYLSTYRYKVIDDQSGVCVSTALICIRGTRFLGNFIPTLTVADISTVPEYRNRGLVRYMLTTAHKKARDYGAYISLLHPFSFDFYRKFGYEKISDTVTARIDLKSLPIDSDNHTVKLLSEDHHNAVIDLFRRFSKYRNLMFDRYNIAAFLRRRSETYLTFNNERVSGYIMIEKDSTTRKIIISEIVYENTFALNSLLSYLSQYADEFEIAEFSDVEPTPELYTMLKERGAKFEVRGDLMARLLDTQGLLLAYSYPEERGSFTLRVEDDLDTVRGDFLVKYENKKCTVEHISIKNTPDITATASALMRLLYGCDGAIDNIKCNCDKSKLIRLFPRQINGLFEHF